LWFDKLTTKPSLPQQQAHHNNFCRPELVEGRNVGRVELWKWGKAKGISFLPIWFDKLTTTASLSQQQAHHSNCCRPDSDSFRLVEGRAFRRVPLSKCAVAQDLNDSSSQPTRSAHDAKKNTASQGGGISKTNWLDGLIVFAVSGFH
jgi:CHAD domain-containing protein